MNRNCLLASLLYFHVRKNASIKLIIIGDRIEYQMFGLTYKNSKIGVQTVGYFFNDILNRPLSIKINSNICSVSWSRGQVTYYRSVWKPPQSRF